MPQPPCSWCSASTLLGAPGASNLQIFKFSNLNEAGGGGCRSLHAHGAAPRPSWELPGPQIFKFLNFQMYKLESGWRPRMPQPPCPWSSTSARLGVPRASQIFKVSNFQISRFGGGWRRQMPQPPCPWSSASSLAGAPRVSNLKS